MLGKRIPLIIVKMILWVLVMIVLISLSVLGGMNLLMAVIMIPLILVKFFCDVCEDCDCGDGEMVDSDVEGAM